jgi:hypothetical protein
MIDPRYLSLVEWTDAVNLTLATLAPITVLRLQSEDWQGWAYTTVSIPAIASFCPPNPKAFTDWRAWAERFVQCVPI